jgi:hypothetical protein
MKNIELPRKPHTMSKVNLDALIPREDFATTTYSDMTTDEQFSNIGIIGLSGNIILPYLRKPDFQRETSEWDKKNIFELLDSLINNDLIPSIILWRSNNGYYFVLDGAHRLSALIAWYKDDYGDGETSRKYYKDDISPAQKEAATIARNYINKKIGAFKDIQDAPTKPNANPKHIEISKKLGRGIPVQWLIGNADKAERSFFKINKQGAPLNATERKLLQDRKKANCIAARAIIKRGKGYKYWADFSPEIQEKITDFAEQIFDTLFLPPLTDANKEMRSLEQPIAGNLFVSATLPLIYEFITLTNNLDLKNLEDDKKGDKTISCLQNARKVAFRLNSRHTSSLGLHPVVYFFSSLGRHQPTAVLAVTKWVMEMEQLEYLKTFIKHRSTFEDFIIKYKHFFNQVTKKFGSGAKGYLHLKDLLWYIIKQFADEKTEEQIISSLEKDTLFKFLNVNDTEEGTTSGKGKSRKFTPFIGSGIFIKEHLPAKARCKICGGHIDAQAITKDHIIRKREEGLSILQNGQIAHPYCNSIYKR